MQQSDVLHVLQFTVHCALVEEVEEVEEVVEEVVDFLHRHRRLEAQFAVPLVLK